MKFLVRALLILVVLAVLAGGGAYYMAGSQPGPSIDLRGPDGGVGQTSQLEFSVEAPGGKFTRVEATLEQEGKATTVFTMDPAAQPAAEVKQASADWLYIARPIGKQAIPELKAGPLKLTIVAVRPVLYGLRTTETRVTRDLEVRLEPPRVGVLSLHQFVNHGGAEFVVFRATPPDVTAGVKVANDVAHPAFPGSSVGIADPGTRVAFFVLRYDQDLNAPVSVFARDPATNAATSAVDRKQFPKPFMKSRIEIDDRFLGRVVRRPLPRTRRAAGSTPTICSRAF